MSSVTVEYEFGKFKVFDTFSPALQFAVKHLEKDANKTKRETLRLKRSPHVKEWVRNQPVPELSVHYVVDGKHIPFSDAIAGQIEATFAKNKKVLLQLFGSALSSTAHIVDSDWLLLHRKQVQRELEEIFSCIDNTK